MVKIYLFNGRRNKIKGRVVVQFELFIFEKDLTPARARVILCTWQQNQTGDPKTSIN